MELFKQKQQFMQRKLKDLAVDDALYHAHHKRPMSRRDFIAQGMMAGSSVALGGGLFGALSQRSYALEAHLEAKKTACGIIDPSTFVGKIPFIAFDLAGGANIAGSNVLVGQQGGQLDFLSTAGYNKLGLPGDMIPPIANATTGTNDFINTELGLAFHSDSAFLRGIQSKTSVATRANTNGVVFPARSENDTGNNPHNPMYGIYATGARGSLLDLIGSVSSESGGNSLSPSSLLNPAARPTKIDRPTDVTGLVDLGKLIGTLSESEVVNVMEAIERISDTKMARMPTKTADDAAIKALVECGYIKSADLAERFGNPADLNPELDLDIVSIFGNSTDREHRKTASIMKLVVNGLAGAGTVTMGGFDYHTGDRSTGEQRDFRAGECMGACLEYAALLGRPLMLYVFSDGAVSSNGMVDDSVNGRGKGQWTGDNQATAATFSLVYNPNGRPVMRSQQVGFMSADASVVTSATPAANNVNLLVETVLLNYLSLHDQTGDFPTLFPNHSLGNAALMDSLIAFENLA